MYSSSLFISVFFFFGFNFLTVHQKKFTLSDFHQEQAFNQFFYLYQEFMFLCPFMPICLFLVFRLRTSELELELMNRYL